ncbi:MAG: class I SAM-dependent methyltransferase, partial [Actinomycetes bacterium]
MADDSDAPEDLWEANARWWIDGFTDGVDAEYEEQILPLAAEELAGATRVLDIGCGEGQVARLAKRIGADLVVGIDPTWNQIRIASDRAGG